MTAMTMTRSWTLLIPAPAKMFSANARDHWRVTSGAKKLWREAAFLYATQAKLPTRVGRVRIDIVLHFTINRARDDANFHPYVGKPIVDGLGRSRTVKAKNGVRVEPGYELIADDTPEFLDGPHITVGAKVPKADFPYGLAAVTITHLGEPS